MPGIRIYCFVLLVMTALTLFTGCAKEYSFEGGQTIPSRDTIITGVNGNLQPPICTDCLGNDAQIENRWSLHVGNLIYCGIIDTAIATPDRTGFTFFGPSSCSVDSGMVITIYLDGVKLDHDFSSYTTNKVGFYYYDNVTPSYMLITQTGQPFSVTINNYEHSARLIRGTFGGFAMTSNRASSSVTGGKFKLRLL